MHILLTRPLDDCKELILRFKSLGHKVSHLPVIKIQNVNYDKVNINDNIVQTNTATDELIVRGKGVGGSHHLKLDDHVTIVGNVTPDTDNAQDFGSSTKRWANIYSADLQLSNVGTGGNEVDGTEGKWTLQEAEDTVYMINRLNGKRYKIKMEEV